MYNIYLNTSIYIEFKPNEFDNNVHQFQYIFKMFISVHINNIECSTLFTEWVKNLNKSAYHKNLYKDETTPSLKKKIDFHADKNHWP